MARAAYVTDLKTLQGECSANYLRLLRLVGDGDLHLAILQEAPYTTLVEVTQSGPLDAVIEGPRMRVHLYHDVRMAEVVDFQRERHFSGRYRYPNARMHQPDEKLQLNCFLGEWLAHGLAHGHAVDMPELR